MYKIIMVALVAILFTSPLRAETISDSDKQAFRQIVTGQLEAMKSNDDVTAYNYAAPIIKGIFPTPEIFMAMVKRGYPPVYQNNGYKLGAVLPDGLGRPAVHVVISAIDGKRYEAVYSMQRQPDGSWKIAACALTELPGVGV
jgi:Domain of unknown function (DUF4864)